MPTMEEKILEARDIVLPVTALEKPTLLALEETVIEHTKVAGEVEVR